MNARQLWMLTIAALGVIAVAIWLGFSRSSESEQNPALYPSLRDQLAKVQAIRLFQAQDQLAIELTRSASGWTVKQRDGYAADTQKVNALLLGLADAKLLEEKTRNPENYPTLGVQELAVRGATGARVELVGLEPPIKLIVGKSDATARATYVRRAGEPQSWLVSQQLSTPTDVPDWLRRDLLNIGAERIQEVAVSLSGNPSYSAIKTKIADANFDVAPLPKKRELNSVSVANSVAQALLNLQLDDVRPAAELDSSKSVAQASFRTFDGLVVDVTGHAMDDKRWITVKSRFDAELAKRFHVPDAPLAPPASPAPPAATPPSAASIETTSKKVIEEAAALNKQTEAWAYAVATYKYDAIFKPIEQLLRQP